MKAEKALFGVALAASVLAAASCASSKVVAGNPEDFNPMAVTEFTVNQNLKFFSYRNVSLKGEARSAASKAAGGGLLGRIAGSIASAATEKAEDEAYPYLKTGALVDALHVQQIVMEGLAAFPEVSFLLTAEDVAQTKAYASIKNSDSESIMSVGNFKYLDDDKKTKSAVKALEKSHKAKGFASIHVQFGYYLDENESKLDKTMDVLNKIGGQGKHQSENGFLYPSVTVTVNIMDKDGKGLTPAKHYYKNGKLVEKNKKDKEDLKDPRSRYVGVAVGASSVPITYGKYSGEEFYALYTEDLLREAVHNAALRQ